jgi:uncharacterized protein (DUF2342 family)
MSISWPNLTNGFLFQVRSTLEELELQSTQVVNRLENLKVSEDDGPNQMHSMPMISSGFLQSDKKSRAEILSSLEVLISQLDGEEEQEYVFPPLDDPSHLAVVTQSIAAYLCADPG